MGDIGQTQNDDGNEDGQQQSAGDLRSLLEAEKEKNRKLSAENTGFKQHDQLRDLGFGHLSKRQSQVLLKELAEDGKELDETNVTAMVTDLGFLTEAPKRRQAQGDPNGQGGDSQGQQQEDQDGDQDGDQATEALSAIALMQQAHRFSSSSEVNDDFSNQIKQTKNKEELRDLIRTKGPRNRIIHEWDVP